MIVLVEQTTRLPPANTFSPAMNVLVEQTIEWTLPNTNSTSQDSISWANIGGNVCANIWINKYANGHSHTYFTKIVEHRFAIESETNL